MERAYPRCMVKTIKAKFSGGVFKPLESTTTDLAEGTEVILTVSTPAPGEAYLKATAGGWKGLVDAERLKYDIYADRLVTRPSP